MNLQLLIVLGLFALPIGSNNLPRTFAADAISNIAEKPAPLVADESTSNIPWIELICTEGPKGIVNISENLAWCGDVQLKPHSKGLIPVPGNGVVAALTNSAASGEDNLLSKQEFGDCMVNLEFLIGKGSNSGVKLQRRYEIQLHDSHHVEKPSAKECGGIYPHWLIPGNGKVLKYLDEGVPPKVNAAKPAGVWQSLKITFRAPRFDTNGNKTENARFLSVILNGQRIHQDVEVDSPTGDTSSPLPEVAEAQLYLQMDHGAVAFRNVRVKPLNRVSINSSSTLQK